MSDAVRQQVQELNEHIGCLYQQGDYLSAVDVGRQALEIAEHLQPTDELRIVTMANLASMLLAVGEHTQAESIFCSALAELPADGSCISNRAACLANLGNLYLSTGRFDEAEPLIVESMELVKQQQGKDSLDYAIAITQLGDLHFRAGRLASAQPLFQESLEIRRAVAGEWSDIYATGLNNLAELYQAIRSPEQAEPLLTQALAIDRNTHGHDHPQTIPLLNNLAELYMQTGQISLAEPLILEALNICQQTLGTDHPIFAVCVHNQAALLQLSGDLDASIHLHLQAIEAEAASLGEEHPDYALRINGLAILYAQQGDYERAKELMQQAVEIVRLTLGEKHPAFARRIRNLAGVQAARGEFDEAIAQLSQAAEIEDWLLGHVFSFTSDRERLSFLVDAQQNMSEFLSLIAGPLASCEMAGEAFDLVLRRKAIVADTNGRQRAEIMGGRYPHLKDKFDAWSSVCSQIAQQVMAGPSPQSGELAQLYDKRDRLERTLASETPKESFETWRQDDMRRAVALALPDSVVLIEFVRYRQLDFTAPPYSDQQWRGWRYLAFTLDGQEGGSVQIIDLGDAESIDTMVDEFREAIIAKNGRPSRATMRDIRVVPTAAAASPADETEIGRELFDRLVSPIAGLIRERKHWIIAPDGNLTKLPFEALPNGKSSRLIDERLVSYVTTGRDILRWNSPQPGRATKPLVICNPDFELANDTMATSAEGVGGIWAISSQGNLPSRDLTEHSVFFSPLPGTQREGELVAEMLGVRALQAQSALKGELCKHRSPKVLHLATHGFFLQDQLEPAPSVRAAFFADSEPSNALAENPMVRSGLALAGANTWLRQGMVPAHAVDGLLTAADVQVTDLSDTELVVLSACETGLGELNVSEGVMGLRRSFSIAGARTLVMSLWKVPDNQTCDLMQHFYQNLLSGQSRVESLRAAQLTVREQFSHPFYWAGFICQGLPDQLQLAEPLN